MIIMKGIMRATYACIRPVTERSQDLGPVWRTIFSLFSSKLALATTIMWMSIIEEHKIW